MVTNTGYWSDFFDDYVKKHKGNCDSLYYIESIEHKENFKKILQVLSDNPDSVILDAGCGVGEFLIPASYNCKLIYGIDISNESVKRCGENLKERNIENASLKVSSLTEIPFENGSMDKILCISVLQYLDFPEIETAFREFKRILKNKGVLVINFANGGSPYGFSTNLLRFIRRIIKGKKHYPSTYIPYKKLKKIIENEKGTLEILHSANFYPILFPESIMRFIGRSFYFEKYLPKFLRKYGFSISIVVRF
jgi:ubiquinone/menaquinone biosynthesis C-methylase UbiE